MILCSTKKFETTSTGIDVTGSTVTDGLLSTGAITVDHSDGTDNISLTPTSTGGVLNVRNSSAASVIALDGRSGGTINVGSGSTVQIAASGSSLFPSLKVNNNGYLGSASATNAIQILTSGGIRFNNAFTFPTSDGSSGQFLTTNGAGTLSFATAGATLSHSAIADATVTVSSSATTTMNTFAKASFRSAKYVISIADAANDRFEVVEANVTHDGTNAFISTFGSVTDYTAPLTEFTADISGSDVRVRVTNITSDSLVFKFQRIVLNV